MNTVKDLELRLLRLWRAYLKMIGQNNQKTKSLLQDYHNLKGILDRQRLLVAGFHQEEVVETVRVR